MNIIATGGAGSIASAAAEDKQAKQHNLFERDK
jgi:hypothetical protein